MKVKAIVGIAAATAFAWSAGANAAWFGHGKHHSFFGNKQQVAGSMWNGYEVQTPSSVDESAPWRANEAHMPGPIANQSFGTTYSSLGDVSYGTGASSSAGGYGSGGFASADMNHSSNMSFGTTTSRPYWMLDE